MYYIQEHCCIQEHLNRDQVMTKTKVKGRARPGQDQDQTSVKSHVNHVYSTVHLHVLPSSSTMQLLGDSCLPLKTIITNRMYQTIIQYSDIPADVVLANLEIKY